MIYRQLIFFFVLMAFLNAASLQQTYLYKNPVIYSTDLSLGCPKHFEIVRISDDKTSFRLNSQIIAKTFELNGCTIDVGNIRFVNFIKQSGIDVSPLREQLSTLFLTYYPNMLIQSINIYPRGYIDTLPENAKAVFDTDTVFKNKGTFYVIEKNGVRRYFDFVIDATLSALHTNQKVARKEMISPSNTMVKSISFTSFRGKPLIDLPPQEHRFRASLRDDTIILDRYLEPLPIVLRGAKVSVQVKNGSVVAEFIATATQEGALYDIITIEKADKKRSRAKVIGNNQVELQ